MKIKSADILFLLIICMMTASSCVKEKLETIYQKQESQIDSYLSKNNTAKRDSTIIYEDGTKKTEKNFNGDSEVISAIEKLFS